MYRCLDSKKQNDNLIVLVVVDDNEKHLIKNKVHNMYVSVVVRSRVKRILIFILYSVWGKIRAGMVKKKRSLSRFHPRPTRHKTLTRAQDRRQEKNLIYHLLSFFHFYKNSHLIIIKYFCQLSL